MGDSRFSTLAVLNLLPNDRAIRTAKQFGLRAEARQEGQEEMKVTITPEALRKAHESLLRIRELAEQAQAALHRL